MFKFFKFVTDLVTFLANFIRNAVVGLVSIFNAIASGVAFVFNFIAYVPAPISGLVLSFVAYCVVINIINKGE